MTQKKKRRRRPGLRPQAEVVSAEFQDLLTRDKTKNGAMGDNKAFDLDWRDYIEYGYNPMEADTILAELAERSVAFGLDQNGHFAYDEHRLTLPPGLRASIDYRVAELTTMLRASKSLVFWTFYTEEKT